MKDKLSNTSLKSKIALSYFLILLASGVAIFFLYTGIKNLQLLDKKNTKPNTKLFKINQILTLIYEAENQTRSYFLLRNKNDFDSYIQTLNKIGENIDSLAINCHDNPNQIKHLSTIKELLSEKKKVITQLKEINSPNKRDFLYTRALEEVYIQAYELSKISRVVREKIVITHDTIIEPPKKKSFMKRIFSSNDQSKTPYKIAIEKKTQSDTVIQEGFSPDTIVKTLQRALENLKNREDNFKDESVPRETQLLYNDRVLLDKIRAIATLLETEELQTINRVLNQSTSILQKASYISMLLASIAVGFIIIFLILIFRDISLSRKRQLALQEATRQSEELMKMKEQFLATMSHEIRTPLGTIIGFTEQLQKTKLEGRQEQYVNTIDKASAHLLDLVNDILDLSKIEAGRFTLEMKRFNLTDLLEEVCNSFSLQAKNKNLEMSCIISPELNSEFLGDAFRIRQVLINIVGNALKFTESGSITIKTNIISKNKHNALVNIAVTDTGIGIAPEKQEEVFGYFSQADSGTSRKYGGTGLGLAISRRIIELHNGTISLKSNLNEGSTFTIELHLDLPEQTTEPSVIQSEVKNQFSMEKLISCIKGKRILVVDDDEVTSMLISSLLKNIELSAEILNDSSKVIEAIEAQPFDMVLTDIHMPGLNGIELLNSIRNHPNEQIRNIPVVASTANVTEKDAIINSKFSNYLSKPFKEEVLYRTILSVLCTDISNLPELPEDLNEPKYIAKQDSLYSLEEVSLFIGNDPEALRRVVNTFVDKSLQTIQEMEDLAKSRNIEDISFRAHKLIPSFKQFKLLNLVDDLVTLERYEEHELPSEKFFATTQRVFDKARPILMKIKNDVG